MVVRLDPDALRWTVFPVPSDDAESDALVDGIHVVDDDVVLVQSQRGSTIVRRLGSDGRWSTVADLPSESRSTTCVADGAVWLFRVEGGGSTDIGATDTTYGLTRLGLDDGQAADVELPELAAYFGGVTVPFGCNGAGPLVATTPTGAVPAADSGRDALESALTGVAIWHHRDGDWHAVPTDTFAGTTVASQVISGPDGAVVRGAEMNGPGANRPIAVVVGPTGAVTEIETDGDDEFAWRGSTDQLVRVDWGGPVRLVTVVDTEP